MQEPRLKKIILALRKRNKMYKFKAFYEAMTFKVEVEGLPAMYIDGNSPAQVKGHLRKLVKQPSLIKSVSRLTKHDVKKVYRDKASGKKVEEMTQQSKTHPNLKIAVGKSAQSAKDVKARSDKRKANRRGTRLAANTNCETTSGKVDYGSDKSIKIMKNITPGQNVQEGINDPGIFKAVFLAGGPGSGKSFIVGQTALTALGLKLINSDDVFEAALKKIGMKATPENIYSPKGQATRDRAKIVTQKKMQMALNGRLGLVVDGTGKNYEKIKGQIKMVKSLGYEVAMIFVNTDLETAIDRNNKRDRSLPEDEVKSMWKEVQNNIGRFQSLFRNKMYIVDNSDGSNYKRGVQAVYKKMMAWTKTKPSSKGASAWIAMQKKQRGIEESNMERFKSFSEKKLTGKDSKGHFRATEKGAGMTQAGVNAVNRKTGGNLKTAVTGKVKPGSKAAGRRKSYCARSAGQMKDFPKAANDPNSRLRQARRRWKC